MDEKLEKKLKKLLSKAGIDETKIEEVIADLNDETTVEDEVEETVSEVSNDAPIEETPTEPETPVENTTDEEVAVAEDEGEVAPSDDAPESVEAMPTPEETEQPLPPVEEVAPEVAPQPSELENKIAELTKANDGLKAHLSALEDALKKAGILENETEISVGVDESSTPSGEEDVATWDDTLNRLNRNSF